jgi:hypothetical protein
MPDYRSRTTTHGRNMAGARALWRATGVKDGDFGKPIVAIANSFTQFVPGHVHLKDLGQLVAGEIEAAGGIAKEFNTIAVDDGIAMGHGGMLYSLPSRELIADSVEYMVNAHCADALVCISNCDKITPGMLMAALRLNIPAIFVSGGPMEAGKTRLAAHKLDLVDAMVSAADDRIDDATVAEMERSACPTCGSCSGMFTANSMNCLTEALGLSLPGNGSLLATHADRRELFLEAGRRIVELTKRYYEQGDASVLPRGIATFDAFENAISLDIAMGGSTNTVLHLLAAAREGGVDFSMRDIDRMSRQVPNLCKVAPATQKYHMEDVHRAGGVIAILGELDRAGLLHRDARTVHGETLAEALDRWDIARPTSWDEARLRYSAGPAGIPTQEGIQSRHPLAQPGPGPAKRLHPRPGARLFARRRPGGVVRQPGRGRLHRQNRRGGREQPGIPGTGTGGGKPGRRGGGDSGRADPGGRRGADPLRRPARRPRHAGNALPDQLSQIQGSRQGLRADHRRPLFRWHLGAVHRPCLSRGGRRRDDRPGGRRRPDRDRHPQPPHPSGGQRRGAGTATGHDADARRGSLEADCPPAAGIRRVASLRRHDHQRRSRRCAGRHSGRTLTRRRRKVKPAAASAPGKASVPKTIP